MNQDSNDRFGFVRALFRVSTLALAVAASGLAACVYRPETGQSIADPITRKFAWYSYLDAGDIRRDCATGGAEGRYRLVYNAQFDQQIRAYEIAPLADGRYELIALARGPGNLAEWWIRDTGDFLAPWAMRQSRRELPEVEMAALRDLLHQSGFGEPAPEGLRLHSQQFYWIAAGCEAGQFHYFAWSDSHRRDGVGDFARLRFVEFLLGRDRTAIAFRQPHPVPYAEMAARQGRGDDNFKGYFTLTVGSAGLSGVPGGE